MKFLVFTLTLLATLCASGLQTRNIVLITLDGVRWQEVFSGADKAILNNKSFVENEEATRDRFWVDSSERRREKLMPFFWGTIAKEGQLYGNYRIGSTAQLTNREWFSYPGYNEILVGYADHSINSNEKVWNKNVTVLEFLNSQKQFSNKVAAFCSWDVFPYIINSQRSGIPVSAGEDGALGKNLTERENLLNELISECPNPSIQCGGMHLPFTWLWNIYKKRLPESFIFHLMLRMTMRTKGNMTGILSQLMCRMAL